MTVTVKTSDELKNDLRLFAQDIIKNQPISDDDWFSYNDDIDINIWRKDGELKAAAFDVINGSTQTETWINLF